MAENLSPFGWRIPSLDGSDFFKTGFTAIRNLASDIKDTVSALATRADVLEGITQVGTPYNNRIWKPTEQPGGGAAALTFANSWAQATPLGSAANLGNEQVGIIRDAKGLCQLQGTIVGGPLSNVAIQLLNPLFKPVDPGQRYFILPTERTDNAAIGFCLGIVRRQTDGTSDIFIHNPNGAATVTRVFLSAINFNNVKSVA